MPIIPRSQAAVEPLHPPEEDWGSVLRRALDSPEALGARFQLSPQQLEAMQAAHQDFPLRVPHAWLARIDPQDPADPLLLQVLPRAEETRPVAGYQTDPLAEAGATQAPGLIQKYRGRALLMLSGACALNCRYCFRRHFPYGDHQLGAKAWQGLLTELAADPELAEVILSGGDPLMVPDRRLDRFIGDLEQLPGLKRLRIHSRLPVVIPERITRFLVDRLERSPLQCVLVIHANHPRELHSQLAEALQPLRRSGIQLLNQTVLLRGINDRAETLIQLSEDLFAMGVLPYYLHQLDPVAGAAHFDCPDAQARALVAEMTARLPGYLVPRLVREEAGAASKTLIAPA